LRFEAGGKDQEKPVMNQSHTPVAVRRALPRAVTTTALSLAFLAVAASPTSAAPAATARVTDGVLQISGSQRSEKTALRLNGADPSQLQVDLGDDGSADHTFAVTTFRVINVDGGAGNDRIRIEEVNGAFTTTEATRIAGGNGDDTLIGGSGAEVFLGGNGNDLVDGNGGADSAFLGRGDDVFVWDPGDASDVVEGERGSDTMVFNGAAGNEVMAATADDGRVLFTRNLGNIVMDLDNVEAIDVRALGGTDAVTVNDMGGTDLERVDVDLASAPGGSTADGLADTVTVTGTKADDSISADANGGAVEVSGLAAFVRIANADRASDTLVIDTVAGADEVSVDPALDALILVAVL
jgi:RTX calcium-binding nonapeptide repeat (4 copies)